MTYISALDIRKIIISKHSNLNIISLNNPHENKVKYSEVDMVLAGKLLNYPLLIVDMETEPVKKGKVGYKTMSEIGLRTRMLVKDAMSSPVITTTEDASATTIAKLMEKDSLGCVIITNEEGKPLGIITERDLVKRVLSKNLQPSTVKAKDIMSSPLATIDPEATVSEAARIMSRMDVRRLGVIYKGDLVGLVSSKDILRIMPELIEIIQEKNRIEGNPELVEGEEPPMSGYCERCGAYSEQLIEVNGEYYCEDCRLEVRQEE